jgi:hypothetical protein
MNRRWSPSSKLIARPMTRPATFMASSGRTPVSRGPINGLDAQEVGFALDSSLEGAGFEPSVPLEVLTVGIVPCRLRGPFHASLPKNEVRSGLSAGGSRIRTLGPPSAGFTQTPGSPRIATPGAQIGGKMAKLPVWHRCVISAADHPLRLGQIGPVLRSPSRAA